MTTADSRLCVYVCNRAAVRACVRACMCVYVGVGGGGGVSVGSVAVWCVGMEAEKADAQD